VLPPSPDDRGDGNVVTGNLGDGIRISGAGATHNRILGNLIGHLDSSEDIAGNEGNGISILDGASQNRVGHGLPFGDALPGYGNVVGKNGQAGVLIDGFSSTANSIRQNRIYPSPVGRIRLANGANGGMQPPDVFIDIGPGRVSGNVPVAGFIEIFSDYFNDLAAYHLTAAVGPGDFVFNPSNPDENENAWILDSPRPLRLGEQFISFTEGKTGASSEFAELP
jgi:hypothetical protein